MNFQWILCNTAKSVKRFFRSRNNFRNSTSAPTNEPPLSEITVSGHPWWDANRRRACRKASADAFSTISRWTALDVAQVKIAPQALVDLFLHVPWLDLEVDFPWALNAVVDVLFYKGHNSLLHSWQLVCLQWSNTLLSTRTKSFLGQHATPSRGHFPWWGTKRGGALEEGLGLLARTVTGTRLIGCRLGSIRLRWMGISLGNLLPPTREFVFRSS